MDFLALHAESQPEKPAVICGDEVLDFASLSRRASRAANAFTGLGCTEGDRVAWMSFNSITGAEIANGARRAGLVIVPVNYRLRGPEIAYVLNDSGAKVAAAGPDHVDAMAAAVPDVKSDVRFVTAGVQAPRGWLSYRDLAAAASEQFEAIGDGLGPSMIYTSGTTGNPKGAWRPHGVDIANVLQVISIFELSQGDVHLMCGPGYHSGVSFFSALHQVLGATVVMQPKFEAEDALDLIERHRVTTSFIAPTLLQRLVDAQQRRPRDTSSLRAVILGAAPCPHTLKVRAEAAFGQVLWEFYGATETGINTVLRPEDQMRKPGSCGTAVPGQEIRVVRDDGSDRRVDMIISGGVNIYPAEVEAVLHAHPAVMDAAVIGVPDEQWGESVRAVVQLRADMRATADELIAFCAERLAGYKKPRSVEFVDELPRDAAGKLLKRKLRDAYWTGAGRKI